MTNFATVGHEQLSINEPALCEEACIPTYPFPNPLKSTGSVLGQLLQDASTDDDYHTPCGILDESHISSSSNMSCKVLLAMISTDLARALSSVAEIRRRSGSEFTVNGEVDIFNALSPKLATSPRKGVAMVDGSSRPLHVNRELSYPASPSQLFWPTEADNKQIVNEEECIAAPDAARVSSSGSLTYRTRQERDSELKEQALRKSQSAVELRKFKRTTFRGRIQALVEGSFFEGCFGVMVCLNSVLIGIQTDHVARHPNRAAPLAFYVLDTFFAIVFTLELIFRLIAKGKQYFCDQHDWQWHYFDLISVAGGLMEAGFTTAFKLGQSDESGVSGAGQVRIVRILRAARMLRFFRVSRVLRFVAALRSLVFSIMGTLKSLFWSMILLVVIIYSSSVVFTQVVSEELAANPDLPNHEMEELKAYWGNVSRSMMTLFMSLSDGLSWEQAALPLGEIHWFLLIFFLMYIVFNAFAVMNVITAMFVQSSVESAKSDQATIVHTVLAQKVAYSAMCKSLFRMIDTNVSGKLNFCEFVSCYDDMEVQALFEGLDLEPDDAWSLFKLLDESSDHSITEQEFVEGCMRCRGQVKRMDLFLFEEDYAFTMNQLLDLASKTEAHLAVLTGATTENLPIYDSQAKFRKDHFLGVIGRMQQRKSVHQQRKSFRSVNETLEIFERDDS